MIDTIDMVIGIIRLIEMLLIGFLIILGIQITYMVRVYVLEKRKANKSKTPQGLIFTCPSCQGHRLECCEDGPYNSEILHIDEEGDFDYGEISASGEVDRYQCLECDYILAFDDKPNINLVTNNEEVVEWLKENCKNIPVE